VSASLKLSLWNKTFQKKYKNVRKGYQRNFGVELSAEHVLFVNLIIPFRLSVLSKSCVYGTKPSKTK
jgi:hypothetical protein